MTSKQVLDDDLPKIHQWLADAAYYKSLARGFAPGYELQDWLDARDELEKLLTQRPKHGLVNLRYFVGSIAQ